MSDRRPPRSFIGREPWSTGTAKREHFTCCNRTCCKSGPTVKLSRCLGCFSRVVYCSKECQRAHWSEHKPQCKRIQAEKKILGLEGPNIEEDNFSSSLFNQLEKELWEFRLQFASALGFTANNWLNSTSNTRNLGRDDACLFLRIVRRPNVPDSVPAWARFEVGSLALYRAEDMDAVFGGLGLSTQSIRNFRREREENIREAQRRGHGLIYTYIRCAGGCGSIHEAHPIGSRTPNDVASARPDALPSGVTPEDYFKNEVQTVSHLAAQGFFRGV